MRCKSLLFPLLLLSIIILLTSTSFAAQEKVIQARIYLTPEIRMKHILPLHLDIAYVKPGEYFDFITDAKEIEDLREKGLKVEIMYEDLVAFYRSRLDTTLGMGGYHTYEETGHFLDSMHNEYPAITTDTIAIDSSWEGRSIWAFKISDSPQTDEDEPEVLYDGLHHAREPISIEVQLYFITYLCENYGSDLEVTQLVNSTEFWFVPIVNPDGYEHNRQTQPGGGGMWRKNRRDNGDGTFGVDLNRNYGFEWGYDDEGSSPNTYSTTYRGPAPFSEPETQAMRDFICDHDFVIVINYHATGGWFIYPWGYVPSQPTDYLVDELIGDSVSYFTGYVAGTGWATLQYATNGDADDWGRGEQNDKKKVFGYTPEVGWWYDGFWPAAYRIPQLSQDHLQPNLFYARMANRLYDHSIRFIETDPNLFTLDTVVAEDSIISMNLRAYNHDTNSVMYYNITTPDSFEAPLSSPFWLTQKEEKYVGDSFEPLASTYDFMPLSFSKSVNMIGDWLRVDQPTGSIPPDSYQDFTIIMDGSVVEGDYFGIEYNGGIVIATSNDRTPLYCDTSLVSLSLSVYLEYWNQHQNLYTDKLVTSVCNNTNVGSGMQVGMRYIGSETSFLNEGSFFAGYISDQGDTIIHREIFKSHSMRVNSHLNVDDTSDPTAAHAYFTTGTVDQDLEIIGEMIAPSHSDSSEFYILKYKVCNKTGAAIESLHLGMVMDWDVVSLWNESGFDESFNLIWQNTGSYHAGLSYLSQDSAYGASIVNNETYVWPQNDFLDRDLFQFISTPGFHADFQQKDLSSLMTGKIVDLGIDDTAEVDFVLALCVNGVEGLKENILKAKVFAGVALISGDVNNDGKIEVADVVYLVNYIFKSGPDPIPVTQMGDVECDGNVNVVDVVYLINYLFKSGPPPCIQ